MEVVFIKKFPSSRSGGSAVVKVFSKPMFVQGAITDYKGDILKDRNNIQYCKIGECSKAMCSMTVEEFEEIFTPEEIHEMTINGMLDYRSKTSKRRYLSLDFKYPMFGAKVYAKYGLDLDYEVGIKNI